MWSANASYITMGITPVYKVINNILSLYLYRHSWPKPTERRSDTKIKPTINVGNKKCNSCTCRNFALRGPPPADRCETQLNHARSRCEVPLFTSIDSSSKNVVTIQLIFLLNEDLNSLANHYYFSSPSRTGVYIVWEAKKDKMSIYACLSAGK